MKKIMIILSICIGIYLLFSCTNLLAPEEEITTAETEAVYSTSSTTYSVLGYVWQNTNAEYHPWHKYTFYYYTNSDDLTLITSNHTNADSTIYKFTNCTNYSISSTRYTGWYLDTQQSVSGGVTNDDVPSQRYMQNRYKNITVNSFIFSRMWGVTDVVFTNTHFVADVTFTKK